MIFQKNWKPQAISSQNHGRRFRKWSGKDRGTISSGPWIASPVDAFMTDFVRRSFFGLTIDFNVKFQEIKLFKPLSATYELWIFRRQFTDRRLMCFDGTCNNFV